MRTKAFSFYSIEMSLILSKNSFNPSMIMFMVGTKAIIFKIKKEHIENINMVEVKTYGTIMKHAVFFCISS